MQPYLNLLIVLISIKITTALNKSYYFNSTPVNFQKALTTCNLVNGTVVSIESLSEENFIIANYLNLAINGIWLAIYDIS